MADALGIVVVSATRRDLIYTIYDPVTGNPVNLTGGSAALQGRSRDVPGKTINSAMTLLDAANGVVTLVNIGAVVAASDLTGASVTSGTFRLQIKFTDATAKIDYTPEFLLTWTLDPTVLH